ncbi:deoxyribonuclease IV [Patescibacteria group bacterium]|nr:deoxyribonuclease IV [Patescibacteria group bacterium]MBU4353557.1 deoxyribonuclease IV [Patescibacteria group bacterium]MBU4476935.1 deoxyribonuclease IV [Patescibacteria group bacterium]MCG2699045.1 deoxyribonuclease IV [Candidatus Parcubacteria bacterium]
MTQVGCHVSIARGIENSPKIAYELGCEAMQIFTRSPQGGAAAKISEETAKKFKVECGKYKIKNIYVHTPYYINLASKNNRVRYGSINAIRIELERAGALGAKYVMTHLGSAKELGAEESFKKVIEGLKKVLDGYKGTTKLLIENSAGAGDIIGADFEEIGKILSELNALPALAGICLDTQHSFASGYDWKNDFDKNMKILGKHIGFKNVKLIHANDSASETGSRKDRHANIGDGKIGLEGFKKIARFAKKNKIDMICETAYPGVIQDIKILKNFIR